MRSGFNTTLLIRLLVLLLTLLFQAPAAHASGQCEALFRSNDEGSLLSIFRGKSAYREARKRAALLIQGTDPDHLSLKELGAAIVTDRGVDAHIRNRFDESLLREQLEGVLLKEGFKPTSTYLFKFLQRHRLTIDALKISAINGSFMILTGSPFPVYSTSIRLFSESQNRALARTELVIEFARRMLLYAVIGIMADELLQIFRPSWKLEKAELKGALFGTSTIESPDVLKAKAYEKWKKMIYDLEEGRVVDDQSEEAKTIRERIGKMSAKELHIHIYDDGPLN